jgi:hypothetical protein
LCEEEVDARANSLDFIGIGLNIYFIKTAKIVMGIEINFPVCLMKIF